MKSKITLLASVLMLALFTLPNEAFADRRDRQQRKMSPKKVNKRNKKGLKKWGLAEVTIYKEVHNG